MGRKNLPDKSSCCSATIIEYKGIACGMPMHHWTCTACGKRVDEPKKKAKKP